MILEKKCLDLLDRTANDQDLFNHMIISDESWIFK